MDLKHRASVSGDAAGTSGAIICFARGTLIRTPHGDRRIEHLSQGDLVLTLDHGPQPIRWLGSKTVRASGALAPVRFTRGAIGNDRDLLVSPHHRMLITGAAARRSSGTSEILAPAHALVDNLRITVAYGGLVSYHHMMFKRHEVVIANGAPSESFHPAGAGLASLDACERSKLFAEFPGLRSDIGSYGSASRPCIDAPQTPVHAAG